MRGDTRFVTDAVIFLSLWNVVGWPVSLYRTDTDRRLEWCKVGSEMKPGTVGPICTIVHRSHTITLTLDIVSIAASAASLPLLCR